MSLNSFSDQVGDNINTWSHTAKIKVSGAARWKAVVEPELWPQSKEQQDEVHRKGLEPDLGTSSTTRRSQRTGSSGWMRVSAGLRLRDTRLPQWMPKCCPGLASLFKSPFYRLLSLMCRRVWKQIKKLILSRKKKSLHELFTSNNQKLAKDYPSSPSSQHSLLFS